VHCIESTGRRGALATLAALAAGCGGPTARHPAPAQGPTLPTTSRSQAQPAPAAAPGPPTGRLAPLGPAMALAPAAPALTWTDFKKAAANRMVQASPKGSYLGQVPPVLFGIPILEIELNGDGSVRDVNVVRAPANAEAADTVALAVEAIRRGSPYGDVSRLPRPWKWAEVFLFDGQRRFKPRSLD
jgi:hypothetical protein